MLYAHDVTMAWEGCGKGTLTIHLLGKKRVRMMAASNYDGMVMSWHLGIYPCKAKYEAKGENWEEYCRVYGFSGHSCSHCHGRVCTIDMF